MERRDDDARFRAPVFVDQKIERSRCDERLIGENDHRRLGVDRAQPGLDGCAHPVRIVGIQEHARFAELNLLPDLIRARAEDDDHFIDLRLSEIVQNVLQQCLLAEAHQLLALTETRGLTRSENDGRDHGFTHSLVIPSVGGTGVAGWCGNVHSRSG